MLTISYLRGSPIRTTFKREVCPKMAKSNPAKKKPSNAKKKTVNVWSIKNVDAETRTAFKKAKQKSKRGSMADFLNIEVREWLQEYIKADKKTKQDVIKVEDVAKDMQELKNQMSSVIEALEKNKKQGFLSFFFGNKG